MSITQQGDPPPNGPLVLALGIFGVFLPILGPAAWILGTRGIRAGRSTTIDPTNRNMLSVGQFLGIVGTAWLALLIGYGIFMYTLLIRPMATMTNEMTSDMTSSPNSAASPVVAHHSPSKKPSFVAPTHESSTDGTHDRSHD